MREFKACDVSEYQGKIDFKKLKTEVDAVIIRLGYVGNYETYLDGRFRENARGCVENGIPWGVYVYTYVKTPERMREAMDWVVRQLEGASPQLPVYLDVEELGVVESGDIRETARVFFDRLESEGFRCGTYSTPGWFKRYMSGEPFESRSVWAADWSSSCDYENPDIWQYTSKGRLAGIAGAVDLNRMYFSPLTGDADGDGKITASDARCVLRVSAKLESKSSLKNDCDSDRDGKITARDAREILRLSAKGAKGDG